MRNRWKLFTSQVLLECSTCGELHFHFFSWQKRDGVRVLLCCGCMRMRMLRRPTAGFVGRATWATAARGGDRRASRQGSP